MPNKGGRHGTNNDNDDLLSEYNWDILIEDDGVTTGQIRGRLTLEYYKNYMVPSKPLQFKELQIKLEGLTKIHFKAKAGSRMNMKEHLLLPDPDDPRTRFLTFRFMKDGEQPISVEEQMSQPDKKKRNQHSLPFEITLSKIPSLALPASFSDDHGSVEYELVAYATTMTSSSTSTEVSSGVVVVRKIFLMKQGRLNLSRHPELDRPFVVGAMMKNKRRIFSFSGGGGGGGGQGSKKNNTGKNKRTGPSPRASFVVLEKRGFLPGETMTCQLNLDNPSGDPIGRICIEFVQKITYFAGRMTTSKMVTRVLDVQEFQGDELMDRSIRFEVPVAIPLGLMPSFTRKKKCVDIFYFVQFSIEVDAVLALRGEAMIVIGTARTPISQNGETEAGPQRSSEEDRDQSSEQNFSTLPPPSYTKLGVPRRVSFGNLSLPPPPPYDQIGDNQEGEGKNLTVSREEKVTRSHSMVI